MTSDSFPPPAEGKQQWAEPAEQMRRICYSMAGLGGPVVPWSELPEIGDGEKAWDNGKREWRLLVEPIRAAVLASLASAAPEEDRELIDRYAAKVVRHRALFDNGPRDGEWIGAVSAAEAEMHAGRKALENRLAALREQLDEARRAESDLDETMAALDHLLRSCRAAGFKGRDAVLMGRAVTRDMAALRTQAARDREALESYLREQIASANGKQVGAWKERAAAYENVLGYIARAALRATEGGA